MSIRAQCQFCGRVSFWEDSRAGQFVDCPNCRAEVTVPNPKEERRLNAAFGRDSEGADEFSALPSRRFWGWMLALIALLSTFVFVGMFIAAHVPRKVVNPGPQPVPQPAPAPAIAARNRPNINRVPPPRLEQRRGAAPGARNAVARNGAVRNRGRRNFDDAAAPPAQVAWRVINDPPADIPIVPPNLTIQIAIPPGPNPEVVFPATPSTMVSVGNVGHGRELREIWDYRSGQRIGSTRGLHTLSENLGGFFRPLSTLSSDGRVFATEGMQPLEFVLWDVVADQEISTVRPLHNPTAGAIFAALSNPHRLHVCGQGVPFQVLSVAIPPMRYKGFPRDYEFDKSSLAISPRGRYVAVFDKSRQVLRFYDINTISPAGLLSLPPFEPAGPMNCECVAFSPDGREVAAMFFYNSHHHLACWELESQRLVDRIEFGGNLRAILGAPTAYLFAPLEWFPGQSRWLVYGQGIVDRHAGKLVWIVPDEPHRYRHGTRHVAGEDSLLSVQGEGEKFVLGSIKLPLADIDRAAKTLVDTSEAQAK